jgi:hypothetical protein
MLRDICSGLALAALTAALYTLEMHFGPLNWKLGDDAFDLLVVVRIMLSATAFYVESLGSCLDRACGRTWPRPKIALVCSRKPSAHERCS